MYSSVILFALATILTAYGVVAQTTSVRQVGDIIYCGTIICPKNAINCRVSTKNDPQNINILITREVCSDGSGNIIKQNSYQTSNPSGGIISSESGAGPEYEAIAQQAAQEAALQAQKIHQQIQNQIQSQFNNAFQNFPPFGQGFPFK